MTNNIIENKPILGYIEFTNLDGNKTYGYEVIYYENNIWKRYGNFTYFTNGEQVVEWRYCEDYFKIHPKDRLSYRDLLA